MNVLNRLTKQKRMEKDIMFVILLVRLNSFQGKKRIGEVFLPQGQCAAR